MIFTERELKIIQKASSKYRKDLQKEQDEGAENMDIFPSEMEIIESKARKERRKLRDEIPELTEEESRRLLLKMENELRIELGLPVYEDPTEEAPEPEPEPEPEPPKYNPETVRYLEKIEDYTYKRLNINSRPTGDRFVYMVLGMAKEVLDRAIFYQITPGDLDKLTEDNYHSIRHAVEIIQYLAKYK